VGRTRSATLAVVLLVGGFASACLGPEDVSGKYPDGFRHIGGNVANATVVDENVTIDRSNELKVGAAWNLRSGGRVRLINPSNQVAKEDAFQGVFISDSPGWYTVDFPEQGIWKLHIETFGAGSYSFGFYG